VKIRAIIFIFFYTSFNVGTIINAHFCGENFDHLAVFAEVSNCCDSSCCHNSSFELQIQNDYDAPQSVSIGIPFVFFIQECSGFGTEQLFQADPILPHIETGLLTHSGKQPIYLTNRVFLI
jgi:hypothetical protein